jgi:hypothetical protein
MTDEGGCGVVYCEFAYETDVGACEYYGFGYEKGVGACGYCGFGYEGIYCCGCGGERGIPAGAGCIRPPPPIPFPPE